MTCSLESILEAGTAANQVPKIRVANTKLYVLVVTLSTQENIKLLKQSEPGFKEQLIWRNINIKK